MVVGKPEKRKNSSCIAAPRAAANEALRRLSSVSPAARMALGPNRSEPAPTTQEEPQSRRPHLTARDATPLNGICAGVCARLLQGCRARRVRLGPIRPARDADTAMASLQRVRAPPLVARA